MRATTRSRGAGLAALRVTAVWLAVIAALSGCEEDSPDSNRAGWPLGAEGLACNYVEYDRVAQALGVRFDTAGGARKDDTHTCALTQSGRDYPDLTLSIAATTADPVIFQATVAPSGATIIKGVGQIAYRLEVPTAGQRGPGVELGWLSARGRLMIVRFTFAAGATAAEVADLEPRLLALAKQIESSVGTDIS